MRNLRSTFARMLIATLIGVSVTVGVAVGCAMSDSPGALPPVGETLWQNLRGPDEVVWRYSRFSRGSRVGSLYYCAESVSWNERIPKKNAFPFPRETIDSMANLGRRIVQVAGWPRDCMWGAVDLPARERDAAAYPGRPAPARTLAAVGAISVGRPLDISDKRGVCGYLPVSPIWSGLALNTLFYGTIAWVLMFLPGIPRRWRRVHAGRCVKCGYDRAGLAAGAACPECGGAAAR